MKPSILVISFSPIHKDSRVLRQIEFLSTIGEVTSCGYGQQPPHTVEHTEVRKKLPFMINVKRILRETTYRSLKLYEPTELGSPYFIDAASKLSASMGKFDLVVANDVTAVPLAFWVAKGAPVWVDLHEYALDQRPISRFGKLYFKLAKVGYVDYICKKYLPNAMWITTVAPGIAQIYKKDYNLNKCDVIYSAPKYNPNLKPRPLEGNEIKLVHSGIASSSRSLDTLINAVNKTKNNISLDLYLVANSRENKKSLVELKKLAKDNPKISFKTPVKPHELPETLNNYDCGIMVFFPYFLNLYHCLPNKFFDFIQARLGIISGPSPEMQDIIQANNIGVTTENFSEEALVKILDKLTPENVNQFKINSDKHAKILSGLRDKRTIIKNVTKILSHRN